MRTAGLRFFLLSGALALGLVQGASAAPPDLDAVIAYETRQRLPNGVTRVDSWRERLVRRGDQVWSERVLDRPAGAAHEHREPAQAGHDHKHFNFGTAARLVGRDPKGRVQLSFFDRSRRMIVDVPASEFATAGFDGRWEAAMHLVPPSLVAQLPREAGGSAGEAWHVQKDQGWSHRVRWSEARQLATRIESRRDDGSYQRTISVESVTQAGAAAPWLGTGAYRRVDYDAFMD